MTEPAVDTPLNKVDLSLIERILKQTLGIDAIAGRDEIPACPPAPGYRAILKIDGPFSGYYIGYRPDFTAGFDPKKSMIATVIPTTKLISLVEIKGNPDDHSGFNEERDRSIFDELAAQLDACAHIRNASFVHYRGS